MELTIAYYSGRLNDDESMSSRNKSLLGGSKEKERPYSESNKLKILDKLLEKRLTELSKSNHLEEIGRTNNHKYYRYHWIISHPIEKCRTFKERVIQLAKEGKITLGREDTEEFD